MNVCTNVCQKVSTANAQKDSGRDDENTQRLEKISFRKHRDFTLTLKEYHESAIFNKIMEKKQ